MSVWWFYSVYSAWIHGYCAPDTDVLNIFHEKLAFMGIDSYVFVPDRMVLKGVLLLAMSG